MEEGENKKSIPAGIKLISGLYFLATLGFILFAVLYIRIGPMRPTITYLIFALLVGALGLGILKGKSLARKISLGLMGINLTYNIYLCFSFVNGGILFGMALQILVIWYLLSPEGKEYFRSNESRG
jgi:hypothetical protein